MSQKVLTLVSKKMTLNFCEHTCEVRYPNKKESLDFSKKVSEANKISPEEVYRVSDEFLLSLGCKQEILDQITEAQEAQIIEALRGND